MRFRGAGRWARPAEHQRKITAVRRAIHDLEARRRRVFRILETQDDDDGSLLCEAKERRAELEAEHRLKVSELEHLEQTMPEGGAGAVELLTDLPLTQVNLADLPADTLRSFLDAFAVQISYDLHRDRATLRDAVPNLTRVTRTAIPRQRTLTSKKDDAPANDGGGEDHLQICDMPCRGHPGQGLKSIDERCNSPA